MRKLALLALLAASTPWASAQQFAGTAHFASAMHPTPAGGSIIMRMHPGFNQFSRAGQYPSLLYPFLPYGDGYYNDNYESGNRSESQPQVIILQVPQGSSGWNRSNDEEDRRPPAEALMIELQGDHYVDVSRSNTKNKNDESEVRSEQDQPRREKSVTAVSSTSVNAAQPTTAKRSQAHILLIFRDGHTEEIHDYTIADGSIYATGDLYTDGYWNKKIQLASLDLPATLKTNQSRNIHFALPTSPNEVIVGP